MRRMYHRGTFPRIPRVHATRTNPEEILQGDAVPLQDMTRFRSTSRVKKTVAFTSMQDLISSASSARETQHNVGVSHLSVETESPHFPLEQQAVKIVDELEQDNSLMEDNPLSEQRRLDALREMPESLTLKRTVRKKLVNRVSQKSKGSPISFYKRLKYRYSMSLSKFQFIIKSMLYSIELWYSSIKVIEGHFGSGVATFFRFFRWLFLMNCIVCIFSHLFIVIPQIVYDYLERVNCEDLENLSYSSQENLTLTTLHSEMDIIDGVNSSCLPATFSVGNLFTGEGFFTNTSLYYGHYTNESVEAAHGFYYSIPLAYFFISLFCYLFILVALSVSMARSYRKCFIETMGGVKNVYAPRIFCGWDFSIATEEAALLKTTCIYNELKELLSEEYKSEDEKSLKAKCHLIGVRLSVHLMTAVLLLFTGGVMWILLSANLGYDPETKYQSSMFMSLIVTFIMILSPVLFSWIIKFEEYKTPRTALYVTLFRTYLLGMVVVGVLLAFWLEKARNPDKDNQLEVCWETSLGQEVYRLILMDFFIAIIGTGLAEFVRQRIYFTSWEKIGQPEFDIARNTLNLIYNETLFFVGFFFSPPLSLIIVIKMFITFYIKKVGVLHNCCPSPHTWRAAQTQTVFLVLSFLSLLGVIVVYGYILTNVKASDCGPFRAYTSLYAMVVEGIFQLKEDHQVMKFILFFTKPGVVAGVLLGMCIGVYYLSYQSKAQMHMVEILREMLLLEARDKEFLLKNISKVTQGAWLYGSRSGCNIFNTEVQNEPEGSNSKALDDETNSSSMVSQKVSEWLLKSAGSTTTADMSTSSGATVGEAARSYYKHITNADGISSVSDSSVSTSVADINESQEERTGYFPRLS